jgi:hypothetical protein
MYFSFNNLVFGNQVSLDHYSPVAEYWQKRPLAKEIAEIASGSFQRKNPPEIQGTGYVVKSPEAALWVFYKSKTFEEGCLMAVNLGEDADTTAPANKNEGLVITPFLFLRLVSK